MWRKKWRSLWNPDMYHGWGKQRQYFEGWYFKLVAPERQAAFAVIPGISFDEKGQSEAFVQVMDGLKRKATYHRFPATAFQPSDQRFELQLGPNFFSREQLQLDLPELRGTLYLKNPYPWPTRLLAPGIMGWYSFVPFMECYHGIVSMDHQLEGQMEVYGNPVNFTGGQGYAEKDWGRSFPAAWIWLQSNSFDREGRCSIMASVAKIPWLGSSFVGFIVGFLLDGKLYPFATYNGTRMKAMAEGQEVRLAFRRKDWELHLIARQAEGTPLVAPIDGAMAGKVNESLLAEVDVELFHHQERIFKGRGRQAGMELAGEVEALLTEKWRK